MLLVSTLPDSEEKKSIISKKNNKVPKEQNNFKKMGKINFDKSPKIFKVANKLLSQLKKLHKVILFLNIIKKLHIFFS